MAEQARQLMQAAGSRVQVMDLRPQQGQKLPGGGALQDSLLVREQVAERARTVLQQQPCHAVLCLAGSHHGLAGCVLALARTGLPGLVIDDGSMATTPAVAGLTADLSMAAACEALGLSPLGASSLSGSAAGADRRVAQAVRILQAGVGETCVAAARIDRAALDSAMALVIALGGSADVVLHLLAIARTRGVAWSLPDVERLRARTPVLCDFPAAAEDAVTELAAAGGVPQLLKILRDRGLIHAGCRTACGRTLAVVLDAVPASPPPQAVLRGFDHPVADEGWVGVLEGNLAPAGCVVWLGGTSPAAFSGPARVCPTPERAIEAVRKGEVRAGEALVIAGQGPRGGPGMPVLQGVIAALAEAGLATRVVLVTDGRLGTGGPGLMVGHVAPEGAAGGPIGLVQSGDLIQIDTRNRTLTIALTDEQLSARRMRWQRPVLPVGPAEQVDYVQRVSCASRGAVIDAED